VLFHVTGTGIENWTNRRAGIDNKIEITKGRRGHDDKLNFEKKLRLIWDKWHVRTEGSYSAATKL